MRTGQHSSTLRLVHAPKPNRARRRLSRKHEQQEGLHSELILILDERTPDRVFVHGKTVLLQFLQFRLAWLLADHPGVCVPKHVVYMTLWGSNVVVGDNQIPYQLNRLRRAIRLVAPGYEKLIKTIRKQGVLLNVTKDEVRLIPNPLLAAKSMNA